MSASVSVTPTDLGPAEAFERYADEVSARTPISSLNILPAELCGYSGQELRGMWSGDGGAPIRYADRLAHVWTDGSAYLVVVHVQGPQGTAGLPEVQDLLMGDVGVRIP